MFDSIRYALMNQCYIHVLVQFMVQFEMRPTL